MTKPRMDGLYLVLLGCAMFLLVGFGLENAAPVSSVDFRVMYFSARCFLEHCDPYQESNLRHIYHVEGGETPADSPLTRKNETQYIYLPSAFSLTAPFAVLPFWPAHVLWLVLTAGSFIFAGFLVFDMGASYAPVLAGSLVCVALADAELFLILGNPAGIAISLCIVSVWCFLRERYAAVGIVCLAVSLMLKPHDSGLIWLYFLLAGGANRRRALQALAMAVALSLPSILWLTHVAPNWVQEWHSNLVANSGRGGLSDPGPSSIAAHGIGMVVSLQPVISLFRDDSRFYNPLAWLVCGTLLLVWLAKTLRSCLSPTAAWFAIAPIAALSMLPIYHRIYDAKLLLLTIPACAILWSKRGPVAWIALSLTTAGILLTGGIPWALFLFLLKYLNPSSAGFSGEMLTALQVIPAPMILLAVGVFYLWVYVRLFSDLEAIQAIEGFSHAQSQQIGSCEKKESFNMVLNSLHSNSPGQQAI
ncbi:MAG: glycosyltransferase family 87 protein [Terracidiphilus sp.]